MSKQKSTAAQQIADQQYRQLFLQMDQGFALIEKLPTAPSQPGNYRYIAVNPAFKKHTGSEDVEGKTILELFPGAGRRINDHYDQVFRTGQPTTFEDYVSDRDIWIAADVFPAGEPGRIIILFSNITERKKAEIALKESEERQNFLLNLGDALRPIADPVEIISIASEMLGKHLATGRVGYGEVSTAANGEINAAKTCLTVVRDWTNGIIPSAAGVHRFSDFGEEMNAAFLRGDIFILEDALQTFDDPDVLKNYEQTGALRSSLTVPLLKQGRVVAGMYVQQSTPRKWSGADAQLVRDVIERIWEAAERAKVERVLRQSELTRRMALEAFNIGMTIWYPQEDYTDSDDRFFELFGLKEGDVINKETALNKLIHPEDRDHYADLVVKALDPTGDGKLYDEYRVIYPDGSIHWIATMGQTIFEGDPPVPARMYGIVQEITDRKEAANRQKRAEEQYRIQLETEVAEHTVELQKSRELLRTIIDACMNSISYNKPIYNAEGRVVDFEVLFSNTASRRHMGGDTTGMRYSELLPHLGKSLAFERYREVAETGIPADFEFDINHYGSNGILHVVAVKASDGIVVTSEDITARKQAEEKIRQLRAEQQQAIVQVSMETLEEERHRISESLHNGLGQVLYGVKISLSGLKPDQSAREFNETINYTNRLLTEAINETRRISHELMPATLEEFGLKAAIDDICRQLADGVKFSCHTHGLTSRLEKYLELAVYRTVQELMMNVVKHAQATRATVDVTIKPSHIVLQVTDNGRGMDASQKDKTGIGLTAIRSKIKLLNGEVNITSSSGNGTSVEVIIPLP